MNGAHCRTCDTRWTGLRVEHCPACHETFTTNAAGDKHRTGKHHIFTGPDRRRCRTVEEMVAKGMTQNGRGQWTSGGTSPFARAKAPAPVSLEYAQQRAEDEGDLDLETEEEAR